MKTFTFILLSTLLLSSLAQDCNNPLLETFNLTGLTEPQSGAGLPFCQNLQNGQTCCSNETVAQFQTLISNLQESLLDTAGLRDQNIALLRANITSFETFVDQLDDLDGDISNLQQVNPTIGAEVRNQLNTLQDISNGLDNVDDNSEFANLIQDYQRRRVVCFNTLLQIQASAWCLACNPNYASLGVSDDGSIAFSAELNNTIVAACLPFTEAGSNFNALFQANQSYERVQSLLAYVQAFRDGGNVIPNITISDDVFISNVPEEQTNSVPANCSGNVCVYQSENLFDNGALNETLAANGAGVIGGADISFSDVGELLPTPTPTPTPVDNGTNSTNSTNNPAGENGTNGTNTTTGETGTNSTNTTTGETGNIATNTSVPVVVVDNSTDVVVDNSTTFIPPARLLQNANTVWNPNLGLSGVQLNVTADPGEVSGLQGDGNAGNGGNPPVVVVPPGNEGALSSVRVVASGLTVFALVMGVLTV